MRFRGFIGPSYTLRAIRADCQRCLGWFPEINEVGTGKDGEVAALIGTPGLRLLVNLGTDTNRGAYTDKNGLLWFVNGNTLYYLSSAWAATAVMTLGTSSGPVDMIDNGTKLFIVDGSAQGYYVDLTSFAYVTVGVADSFLGADRITYQDGYLIFNKPSTGQFYITAAAGITFDPLDIASAGTNPDNLVGHISDSRNLYLIGTSSTEIFYNSGNADFPFERVGGAFIPIGTQAAFSIQKFNGGIAWLGQDEKGRGMVYTIKNFQPTRISTHAIEKVISGLGDLSRARAWTYQFEGHEFYCLNIPGAESTWCYDASTSLWHERATLSQGALTRYRIETHAFAYNTNVVGDYYNGNVYALDANTYSDNTAELPRIRTAPHLSKEGKRMTHRRFEVDMEVGVGIDGSGQGTDPQAMMQFSDNGGKTWSSEQWTTIGALGEYDTRVAWDRLGQCRDRVYKLMVTDPVKSNLIGANIMVEEDSS